MLNQMNYQINIYHINKITNENTNYSPQSPLLNFNNIQTRWRIIIPLYSSSLYSPLLSSLSLSKLPNIALIYPTMFDKEDPQYKAPPSYYNIGMSINYPHFPYDARCLPRQTESSSARDHNLGQQLFDQIFAVEFYYYWLRFWLFWILCFLVPKVEVELDAYDNMLSFFVIWLSEGAYFEWSIFISITILYVHSLVWYVYELFMWERFN